MKTALLAAKQDWEVWTIWYDDRLVGRVRNEERELAYVRIEDALWKQGPAIVNAEIKRRIEELVRGLRGICANKSSWTCQIVTVRPVSRVAAIKDYKRNRDTRCSKVFSPTHIATPR